MGDGGGRRNPYGGMHPLLTPSVGSLEVFYEPPPRISGRETPFGDASSEKCLLPRSTPFGGGVLEDDGHC